MGYETMHLLQRLFGRDRSAADALYAAITARARAPHWYVEGGVPDTLDGRFDMVAAVLSMVLLRLESDPAGAQLTADVAERFVDDMNGQLREIGIGDMVVGKHIGRMMSMLGGRIGAYRDGMAKGDLAPALARNLYRGSPPDAASVAHAAARLTAFRAALDAVPVDALARGELPQ